MAWRLAPSRRRRGAVVPASNGALGAGLRPNRMTAA